MPLTRDEDIAELLTNARTIAVVGCSDRPDRPSYGVAAFLQRHGYRMLPVNPQITGERVHGEFVWRELSQIGVPIDIVDIFRRPDAAGEAVDQAIAARRQGGLDAAGHRQRGGCRSGRGGRPQGGDGPLHQDRASCGFGIPTIEAAD